MQKKNELRPGILVRAITVGVSVPIIGVLGAPVAGICIFVAGFITGAILDSSYFDKQKKENNKISEENITKFNNKIAYLQKKEEEYLAGLKEKAEKSKGK